MSDIRAKDYLRVDGRFYFAVISDELEQNRALAWLRYVETQAGMRKLDTASGDDYVRQHRPDLVFHSETADIALHGIPLDAIERHYRPRDAVVRLLSMQQPDEKQRDARCLLEYLIQVGIDPDQLGITGSLLLDAQHEDSDIDLLVYGRALFFSIRSVISELTAANKLQPLQKEDWRNAYARRDCSLGFNEYWWHEQRKLNKCMAGSSKVDITLMPERDEQVTEPGRYKKSHSETLTARVTDDRFAFDFPARFYIDHATIAELIVFTATYVGQAVEGERIEASGMLEKGPGGRQRLVIGTSREATGEYLKVIESGQL